MIPSTADGQLSVLELPGAEPGRASPSVASFPAALWTPRARLARELHDGVGQSITSLLIQIRAALAAGESGPEVLRILEQEAENSLHSLRRLAYGLRQQPAPDPLDEARQHAERLLEAAGSTLRWIDERSNVRLAHKVAKQLASSIRESITNAILHGGARVVEVRLLESGGRIRVAVRDDGAGFSPEALHVTSDGRGLGLVGNAERMAEIGGLFNIRSRPGEGAVVLLEAPRYLRRQAGQPSDPFSIVPTPAGHPGDDARPAILEGMLKESR